MPGVLHKQPGRVDGEVQTEDAGIALALAMCPEGQSIEIHAAHCDVHDCTCVPRVITKHRTAAT